MPGRDSVTGRVALEARAVHVSDVLADPEYGATQLQKLGGYRTILCVPILREGTPVGVFALTRSEVRDFTPRQIELLETFADQSGIAIENVRLFDEVQARTRELSRSLEELRTAQDRLVQTEKLASLGQLTAGIAHEIKNPLNFVNNFSALSGELIDDLQRCPGRSAPGGIRARGGRRAHRSCSRAISTRSSSTASAPIPSSGTCCCIRGRVRGSTVRSISTPSWRRA